MSSTQLPLTSPTGRARRRLRWGRLILASAVVLGAVGGPVLWILRATLPAFRITNVEVAGLERFSSDYALQFAPIRRTPHSLLGSTDDLIGTRLPIGIRAVRITRRWPHTLSVVVEEVPAAAWTPARRGASDGPLVLVDATGHVLPFSSPLRANPTTLPIVSPATPGILSALSTLSRHAPALTSRIDRVDGRGDGTWRTRVGDLDLWMSDSAALRAVRALPTVLRDVHDRQETPTRLDLRYPGLIVVALERGRDSLKANRRPAAPRPE